MSYRKVQYTEEPQAPRSRGAGGVGSVAIVFGVVLLLLLGLGIANLVVSASINNPQPFIPMPPPPPLPIPVNTVTRIIGAVYGGRDPATTNLATEWGTHGKNVFNSRQASGSMLTPSIVGNPATFPVQKKCDFFTNASVSATPSFEAETAVYFPAWNGKVYKFSTVTCAMIWEIDLFVTAYDSNVSLLTQGQTGAQVFSRATPVLWNNYVIVGMQRPADLVFLDKTTGAFARRITLNTHQYAIVTMSGTISNDWFYVGTASLEELVTTDPSYPCCSFYGTTHGINLNSLFELSSSLTSFVAWTTPTIPLTMAGPGKWSGVGVWGSSPSVDERTGTVYFATGNPYDSPHYYSDCVTAELNKSNPDIELNCNMPLAPNVYYNSVIALDIQTGAVKSFLRSNEYDSWNIACYFPPPNSTNCPEKSGPDVDYGMAPMLDYAVKCGVCNIDTDPLYLPHTTLTHTTPMTVRGFCYDIVLARLVPTYACPLLPPLAPLPITVTPSTPPTLVRQLDPRDIPILYVGQKSGMMHCISADGGKLEHIWINAMCPDAAIGGIHWGAAFDNERVYASCANNERKEWTLPNGTITRCSGWQSYDKFDGSRVWVTVNPACFDPTGSVDDPNPDANGRGYTTSSSGPVSVSNGVVFATSGDTVLTNISASGRPVPGQGGWVYGMESSTGDIIWRYETGASIYGGFSISEKCAYVGIGYRYFGQLGPWSTGNATLAFCTQ